MPKKHNLQSPISLIQYLVLLQFILLAIAACQADYVASAGIAGEPAVLASATPLATATRPVIVYTVAAPTDVPAFAPVSPDEVNKPSQETAAVATPLPEGATDILPAAAITDVTTDVTTATLTLAPTFTPPALPLTSSEEHYWLRRPVAVGGVVWTDKVYPYGSTRGGTLRTHHGVEFNVETGTEILAAASGVVVIAGDDSAVAYGPQTNFYGRLVIIELDSRLDGQPVYILYGHLSHVLVHVGQHVQSEEVVGLSGATGVADGPHLHFEVRVGLNDYNSTRNPLLWLYPFPDRGTVAGRVVWPDGKLVYEAPVSLRRIDAPSRYAATTTYAGDSVNSDPAWQENFALDDVDAGYYEIVVTMGEDKFTEQLWVFPYRTTFVEITLEP